MLLSSSENEAIEYLTPKKQEKFIVELGLDPSSIEKVCTGLCTIHDDLAVKIRKILPSCEIVKSAKNYNG